MKVKSITRPFEIKAIDDDGTFSGYGSVFHVEDSYRDIVMPGAFARTIAEHEAAESRPIMLWQHNSDQPIGVWDEITEDEHGLLMTGRILIGKNVPNADGAHELIKAGAIRGLSIGYSMYKGGREFDEERGITELTAIKLWETSLVTFPANPAAMVTDVRHALEDGIYPSIREVEKLLRDAGFSRRDSQTIISSGYRTFIERDAEGVLAIETLTRSLRRLT